MVLDYLSTALSPLSKNSYLDKGTDVVGTQHISPHSLKAQALDYTPIYYLPRLQGKKAVDFHKLPLSVFCFVVFSSFTAKTWLVDRSIDRTHIQRSGCLALQVSCVIFCQETALPVCFCCKHF